MYHNPKGLAPFNVPDPEEIADLIREQINQEYLDSEYDKAKAASSDEFYVKPAKYGVFNTQPILRAHAKKRKIGKLQRKARRINRK